MPLTVLKSSYASSPEQLVRLFHQSQLEWARHLGEETELDFGRWISAPANCLLDAVLPAGMKPADVMTEINLRSAAWQGCSISPSVPAAQIVSLTDALVAMGWTSHPAPILYRRQPISPSIPTFSDLKIIPARASFRHYRELIGNDLAMLHLDDSHFDALLALRAGQPVGSIGILTSGEVGTVRQWFVHPDHRRQGVGTLLFDRAMEIATRSVLRHVMVSLPEANHPAAPLCEAFGFHPLGIWASFWKDSCKLAELFA